MSNEAVARRYARALFEIGKEQGNLPSLVKEVHSFAEVYEGSDELRELLANPLVDEPAREGVLKDIAERLRLSPMAVNALVLISRKRRVTAVADIARQLARLADEEAGTIRAHVTSASPLGEPYLARLRAELERVTGKRVVLDHAQDPTLIAGVVTRIGDQVVDGSALARLRGFREAVLTR